MGRSPAVEGTFYPGSKPQLESLLQSYITKAPTRKKVLGLFSPHAGYIYSGKIAAEVIFQTDIPETVVILGPNHRGYGSPVSLSYQKWQMLLGDVEIDYAFADLMLQEDKTIQIDETAHQFEHSLEVQVPFLQYIQKNLRIVPIAIQHISYEKCQQLGNTLARCIQSQKKEILLLASTDMNHFESRSVSEKKDKLALDHINHLSPEALYNTVHSERISMCGVIPVTVMLEATMKLGATKSDVLRYTDSGEVSGDTDQVVGYAAGIIY